MIIAAGTIVSSLFSDRLTRRLGADRSQAIISVQMASAYLGTCLMPPLFGVLVNALSVRFMPFYLLALLASHEQLNRR